MAARPCDEKRLGCNYHRSNQQFSKRLPERVDALRRLNSGECTRYGLGGDDCVVYIGFGGLLSHVILPTYQERLNDLL